MDPFSIAALATSVIGGGMQAIGASKSAKAQKASLRMQAADAYRNAEIGRLNARSILDMADINAGLVENLADINAHSITSLTQLQNRLTIGLADINADTTEAIAQMNAAAGLAVSEVNTGIKSAIGDFNLAIADGNYKLLMAAAEFNEEQAEADAQAALDQGRVAEQQSRLQFAQVKGSQRARLAANGVALDSDSSVNLLTATDWASELDAIEIYNSAQRTAYGHRMQGHMAMNEARLRGFALKADAMGAKLSIDAEVFAERAGAQFQAAQTVAAGQMDAFNTRQSAAMAAFATQAEAENTVFNLRTAARQEAFNIRTNAQFGALDARITAGGAAASGLALNATAGAISPSLALATGLMQTAGQVAGQWYKASEAGAFSRGSSASKSITGGYDYLTPASRRALNRIGGY